MALLDGAKPYLGLDKASESRPTQILFRFGISRGYFSCFGNWYTTCDQTRIGNRKPFLEVVESIAVVINTSNFLFWKLLKV
jgi:hypothetical protein